MCLQRPCAPRSVRRTRGRADDRRKKPPRLQRSRSKNIPPKLGPATLKCTPEKRQRSAALSGSIVGVGGLEPPTPASQTRCATDCATPRTGLSIIPRIWRVKQKNPAGRKKRPRNRGAQISLG